MNAVTPITEDAADARHARLFELIRQKNLATVTAQKTVDPQPETHAPQQTIREFANSARKSLLPQEQQALGITSSFGR